MKVDHLRKYLPVIPDDYFLSNTLLSVMIIKNEEKVLWQEISFFPRISGVSSMPFLKVAKLWVGLVKELYNMRKLKHLQWKLY